MASEIPLLVFGLGLKLVRSLYLMMWLIVLKMPLILTGGVWEEALLTVLQGALWIQQEVWPELQPMPPEQHLMQPISPGISSSRVFRDEVGCKSAQALLKGLIIAGKG